MKSRLGSRVKKKQLQAQRVYYSEKGGEYYQVHFEGKQAGGKKGYVILQRAFEFPTGGECYFECQGMADSGHYIIQRARLERKRFWLQLPRGARWEVTFEIDDEQYAGLKAVLRTILQAPHRLQIE